MGASLIKKTGLALLLALAMLVGLLPIMPTTAQAALIDHIVPVKDPHPEGIQLTLADYWLTNDRYASDKNNPENVGDAGINNGHNLKFGNGLTVDGGFDDYNQYKDSAEPYTGIVQNILGADGYPVMSERFGGEPLAYLFNGERKDESDNYKEVFDDVGGLLKQDENYYYAYNSQDNFASFDEGRFTLYDSWAVKHTGKSPDGQFFPFNKGEEVLDENGDPLETIKGENGQDIELNSSSDFINHYFGMHMNAFFQQTPDGLSPMDDETPVTFSFSGDDDVWIFIDDVLVADLGGIHDACSVEIDFADGSVNVFKDENGNGTFDKDRETSYSETTLYKAYFDAQKADSTEWSKVEPDTFADETYHSLDFFYLERGNVDSNMNMKFNMRTVPESDLHKVNQDGKAVDEAVFELREIDGNYAETNGDLIATGTTNEEGALTFRKSNNDLLQMDELKTNGHYLLKETKEPDGYRKSEEPVHLKVAAENGKKMLLSENPWETGAYAMPAVRVTAQTDGQGKERTVKDVDGGTHRIDDGMIVAAIYTGDDVKSGATDISEYQIVYGDSTNGWKVGGSGKEGFIDAAKDNGMQGIYDFSPDSCGAYTANIENLPGSIEDYAWWTETPNKFTGVYFFVEGKNIEDVASADQIHLLDSSTFTRDFSVHLYTPNIENRLLVRKVADDGTTRLNGAEFTLYNEDGTQVDACTTGEEMVDGTKDTGVADMTGIPLGEYYLVETKAPEGYEKSDAKVPVIVDNSGVHVDAGASDDDISVSLGVGKIVKSMVQFADDDGIDATLHDITATLQKYDEGNKSWVNDESEQPANLSYSESEYTLEYGPTKTMAYDSGWGRLNITQNFEAITPENTPKQDIRTVEGTDEPQSLNNLFSGTTIVQVKNSKEGGGEPVPTPDPAKVQFEITKTVTGEGWPEGASFDFTLSGEEGAPMPADTTLTVEQPASGDTATASFDTITFEEPGSYVYTITETEGDVEGMTYDDQTLTATVDVKDTDGKLSASVTYTSDDEDTDFVNDYDEPSTPPTPPDGGDEDKPTPPDLNTVDHYLYIEGYPENYWTGEPSWDESVWPVKPQGDITRAEVATIFYRLLKEDVRDDIETTVNDFTDVNADDWFNVTVSSLANMGVVKGYEDGSFRPNEPITRAEFAAIAVRFFDAFEAKYEPGTFTDVTGDEWFADAIAAAEELGLIGGYEDGSVRPNNNITARKPARL